MEEALRCAQRALESGEVPVGAVVVHAGLDLAVSIAFYLVIAAVAVAVPVTRGLRIMDPGAVLRAD